MHVTRNSYRLLLFFAAAFACLQPLSLYAADPTTVGDVYWTVWHEGCRVFAPAPTNDPLSDAMVPIADVRHCSYSVQANHNGGAAARIAALSDDDLKAIYLQLEKEIFSWGPTDPRNISLNFWWVCVHEGQLEGFKELAARGNFEAIRRTYHDKQNHNPNARNLLSAVTNADVKKLIDTAH